MYCFRKLSPGKFLHRLGAFIFALILQCICDEQRGGVKGLGACSLPETEDLLRESGLLPNFQGSHGFPLGMISYNQSSSRDPQWEDSPRRAHPHSGDTSDLPLSTPQTLAGILDSVD